MAQTIHRLFQRQLNEQISPLSLLSTVLIEFVLQHDFNRHLLSPTRTFIIAVFSATATTFLFACAVLMVAPDLLPLPGGTRLVAMVTFFLPECHPSLPRSGVVYRN